ncbi:MAG: hypothetical protein KC616_25345 [Myxococcales bacterium]|nr:hypothetical protein [Myxococcales bacterium]
MSERARPSSRLRVGTGLVAVLIAAALVVGCGPTLLLPGGELQGTPVEAPADWGFTQEVSTIQLETRPEDPYSVNIWAVGVGPALYVHAGGNRSRWVEHMEADPRVRVRVGDQLYPLEGARVASAEEFARFADAYEVKYGLRPRNENVAEVYLYRLVAR